MALAGTPADTILDRLGAHLRQPTGGRNHADLSLELTNVRLRTRALPPPRRERDRRTQRRRQNTIIETIGYALFDALPYRHRICARGAHRCGRRHLPPATTTSVLSLRVERRFGGAIVMSSMTGIPGQSLRRQMTCSFIPSACAHRCRSTSARLFNDDALGVAQGTLAAAFAGRRPGANQSSTRCSRSTTTPAFDRRRPTGNCATGSPRQSASWQCWQPRFGTTAAAGGPCAARKNCRRPETTGRIDCQNWRRSGGVAALPGAANTGRLRSTQKPVARAGIAHAPSQPPSPVRSRPGQRSGTAAATVVANQQGAMTPILPPSRTETLQTAAQTPGTAGDAALCGRQGCRPGAPSLAQLEQALAGICRRRNLVLILALQVAQRNNNWSSNLPRWTADRAGWARSTGAWQRWRSASSNLPNERRPSLTATGAPRPSRPTATPSTCALPTCVPCSTRNAEMATVAAELKATEEQTAVGRRRVGAALSASSRSTMRSRKSARTETVPV